MLAQKARHGLGQLVLPLSLIHILGDNVEGLAERLTATVEVSRNYRSFSGLTDGMDGAVRFIYRTEAVEKAE